GGFGHPKGQPQGHQQTQGDEHQQVAAVGAGRYLLVFITLSLLVALGLALGVPEAAVGGLRKLSASIEHAAQGNFTASIPVESRDEFGQVAQAFNRLLVHLNEFRTTNLAEVLTERHRVASIVQTPCLCSPKAAWCWWPTRPPAPCWGCPRRRCWARRPTTSRRPAPPWPPCAAAAPGGRPPGRGAAPGPGGGRGGAALPPAGAPSRVV
ncbi:MAG: HAMP domain-containing protein, partial [Hymenobacter sp.]